MSKVDSTRRAAARRPAQRPAGGQGNFKVDQSRMQAVAAVNAAKARNAQAGRGDQPVTNGDVAQVSATARGGARDAVGAAVAGADPAKAADVGAMGDAIAKRKAAGGTQPTAGQPAAGQQPATGEQPTAGGAQPPAGGAQQPTTPLAFNGTIQPGQKDGPGKNDVSTAQKALSTLKGPDGQPYLKPGSYKPGENDAATQAATKKFQEDQKAAGVTADGKIGKQTTAAMNAALEAQGHDPASMKTNPEQLAKEDKAAQAEDKATKAEADAAAAKKAADEAEAAAKKAEDGVKPETDTAKTMKDKAAADEAARKKLEGPHKEWKDAQDKAADAKTALDNARAEHKKIMDDPKSTPQQKADSTGKVYAAAKAETAARKMADHKSAHYPQAKRDAYQAAATQAQTSAQAAQNAQQRAETAAGPAINARVAAGQAATAHQEAQAAAVKARAEATTARGAATASPVPGLDV